MSFKRLSEFLQKLESTSSRNAMVEILAELFKETPASEIGQVTYLLQGRVAPLYEPVEFGMAEKMIVKALAKAFDKSSEEVTRAFKKSGDLGTTAESLSRQSKSKNISVDEIFRRLSEIAQTGGEGSVEKKICILSELLRNVDSLSARFIARTLVDKMRLGFSDMTILDGLSWMIDRTKKHKVVLEAAYNIRPDLGEIARKIKVGGIRGIRDVGPRVGTPILSMRAERLTSATDILEKTGGKAAVEPKLDGFRLQLHFSRKGFAGSSSKHVKLYSRGLEHVTDMYPDIVAAASKEIKVGEVILDGEAIGFNPKTGKYLPFQETVQRKRKYDIEEFTKNVPLKYIIFDCLYLNGESLIDQTYSVRRSKVEGILRLPRPGGVAQDLLRSVNNKVIVPAEMTVVDRPKELEELFEENLKKGLEGIMAKRLDGVYQAGARGWNWIKLKGSYTKSKLADTVDAVVMGLDFGQGKRNKFGVGAFLIGVYDQKSDTYKTISKIGTGLTDEEWRTLAASSKQLAVSKKPENYDVSKVMDCDEWIRPSIVGEFLADELTKSPMHTAGYALRFPRLVRWREKKPEDSTSLKEIGEIAKLRHK